MSDGLVLGTNQLFLMEAMRSGPVPYDELYEWSRGREIFVRYGPRYLRRVLGSLLDKGYVRESDGYYSLTPSGIWCIERRRSSRWTATGVRTINRGAPTPGARRRGGPCS